MIASISSTWIQSPFWTTFPHHKSRASYGVAVEAAGFGGDELQAGGDAVDDVLGQALAPEPLKEALKEGLVTKVSPPTVISPRIKALTTGNIPGFVDIVRNFDTAQLTEDNLIRQWREQEWNMVFYGDDIWTKLFP